MSIHDFSERISTYLAEKIGDSHKTPVLTYGLELIFSEVMKLFVLLIVSYALHLFSFTIFILTTSIPLRIVTGGQHCTSSLRCQIGLLITIIPMAFFAKLFSHSISLIGIYILAIVSTVLLVLTLEKSGPGYSINHLSPSSEMIDRTKNITYSILMIWLITVLVLNYFIQSAAVLAAVVIPMALGVLWQTFMITNIGHITVLKIDKFLIYFKIR